MRIHDDRESSKRFLAWPAAVLLGIASGFVPACAGDTGSTREPGGTGPEGQAGTGCTATDNGDGTYAIDCDGDIFTVSDGTDGGSCSITDNLDGTKTITCDDGTSAIVNDGLQEFEAGEGPGLVTLVSVADPANGTHFVAGEQIVVTASFWDAYAGRSLTLDDLSSARIYMNGPRDVTKTVTPSVLLRANEDRATRPHHYIDMHEAVDVSSPFFDAGMVVDGNEITYTLSAITTEEAGTYTVAIRAALDGYPLDRSFELLDVQIGTAVVEEMTVPPTSCTPCHQGAATGQYYLHHVDPRSVGQSGSPDLDFTPVRNCKMCHNQDGYASRRRCDTGGDMPVRISGVYTCADPADTWSYIPDPIVRRVHGIHNGVNLVSDFNTIEPGGDFEDYLDVVFPANVKNCTKCHVNDNWKTKPSRLACGACHDRVNYETGAFDPPRVGTTSCTVDADCAVEFPGFGTCNVDTCELAVHAAGIQADDLACSGCHDDDTDGVAPAISTVHNVMPYTFEYDVELSMSAPANVDYYVAGEAPVLTIVLKDATTGVVVDPTTITEASGLVNRFYLFINGPRARRIPVLTTAARASTTTAAGTFDLSAAADFQLTIAGVSLTLDPSAYTFADNTQATADEVAAWLNGDTGFARAAYAESAGTAVTLRAWPSENIVTLDILASDVTTALGLVVGVYEAPVSTYPSNVLYLHDDPTEDDPKATWSSTNITYQLDDVAGLAAGTYSVWLEIGSYAALPVSWELLNFQVGTADTEPKVATNCTDCHDDERMHAGYFAIPFNPDICGSCHDYKRQYPDRLVTDPMDGWGGNAASGRSNVGFGSAPLARRIHGVHRGHYLDKPEEIHGSYDYSDVIFPQDIRNCVKCHSETDSWMDEPSRGACLACHDTDAAIAHATLMTVDPTSEDPWNGDEQESCDTCHGADKDFAPAVVHNIWDPYKPPYPRASGNQSGE